MSSSGSTPAARRWWPLLLPLGFLLHIGEEWFGDFAVWTEDALRMPVSSMASSASANGTAVA